MCCSAELHNLIAGCHPRAALVHSCLRGRQPPTLLRAACLVPNGALTHTAGGGGALFYHPDGSAFRSENHRPPSPPNRPPALWGYVMGSPDGAQFHAEQRKWQVEVESCQRTGCEGQKVGRTPQTLSSLLAKGAAPCKTHALHSSWALIRTKSTLEEHDTTNRPFGWQPWAQSPTGQQTECPGGNPLGFNGPRQRSLSTCGHSRDKHRCRDGGTCQWTSQRVRNSHKSVQMVETSPKQYGGVLCATLQRAVLNVALL